MSGEGAGATPGRGGPPGDPGVQGLHRAGAHTAWGDVDEGQVGVGARGLPGCSVASPSSGVIVRSFVVAILDLLHSICLSLQKS